MNTSDFFFLSPPQSSTPQANWVEEMVAVETITCALNPGHQRAGKRLSDLVVKLGVRKALPDVVWTWQSECLLTEKAATLLAKSGLTGFRLRPVTIAQEKNRFEGEIPRLRELTVTGWGGIATPMSGVRLTEKCPECGLTVYSCFTAPQHLIDQDSWDGSDFFMTWPLPRFIMLSPRAATVVRKWRLSGISVLPVSTMTCFSQLTPGHLTDWMPVDQAKRVETQTAAFWRVHSRD
jgi:hypothetical protein